MLEESLVVSSAISAFNNAALLAPAFLWNAVLCIPLFVLCFWFGRSAAARLGVLPYITLPRAAFWTVLITALWCVLMGDNYGVLRDGTTILPWILTGVLFLSMFFVGGAARAIKFPLWYGSVNTPKSQRWLLNLVAGAIILVPVATSNLQNLWVGLAQVVAICVGFLLGRIAHYQTSGIMCSLVIMLGVMVAVLMQPEFFRFGQLGNLTPMHLLWTLGTGILVAVAFALNMACPRGRVHNSAFVKLKWLLRLVAGLCGVLFLLTESVPMFLATVVTVFIMAALSIWHMSKIAPHVYDWAFAASLVMFGVFIGVPTITCIGLLVAGATKDFGKSVPGFVL